MIKDDIKNVIEYLINTKDHNSPSVVTTIINLEYYLREIEEKEEKLNQYTFIDNSYDYNDIEQKMNEYLYYASRVNRDKRERKYQYWIDMANKYKDELENTELYKIVEEEI